MNIGQKGYREHKYLVKQNLHELALYWSLVRV